MTKSMQRFAKNYIPYENLSLDKGMISMKNHLSIRQYIKGKPATPDLITDVSVTSSMVVCL